MAELSSSGEPFIRIPLRITEGGMKGWSPTNTLFNMLHLAVAGIDQQSWNEGAKTFHHTRTQALLKLIGDQLSGEPQQQ